MTEEKKKKNFFGLKEVWGYYFRKKDPNRPTNFSIKAMHTVNKISMLMFLIALVIIFVRRCA